MPYLSSSKRFEVLGGPGGYLTCLPIGHPMREDRYKKWVCLIRVNRPMSLALAQYAKGWVLKNYELKED